MVTRIQLIRETNKSGLRLIVRIATYNRNYTLKAGDTFPRNPNVKLLEINRDFVIVSDTVNKYKMPLKAAFYVDIDKRIKPYDEGYDAHKYLDRTIIKL